MQAREPGPFVGQDQELHRLRWTEQELHRRLQRHRALLELSADFFWQTDAQLRLGELGVAAQWPEALPAMGLMLGRALWEIAGLEPETGDWSGWQQRLGACAPFRDATVRHRRADGRVSTLSLSGMPTFGADGRFTGYLGVGRDITAERASQEALHESQRALSTLIANLPGMAYRCRNHPHWPMEFASDGALALTGHTAAELMAETPHYGELIHPDDRAGLWDKVQAALAAGQQFQLHYRIRTRHGERWVWEQGCGVSGPDGELVALEGFITDVTAGRQAQDAIAGLNAGLEARVQERTAQLEAAHVELQGFAHAVAHDLRAPLTSIDGFSKLLARSFGGQGSSEQLRWLGRISAGVQRMAVLTDALLAMAGLAAATLRDEEVDLAPLARDALARLQASDPERELDAEVTARLPARGDPRLLAQVLAHLLDNAWKFSGRKPRTEIRVGMAEVDGETAFYVADRGAGFDMAHASRLFTGFERLHAAGEFDGAGVGLALVHRIVARHGGRVWAQSVPGEGTTIWFTLRTEDPPARA